MLFLFLTSPLLAAEPNIRNLNVRGLQVGGATTITVDGDDFGKAPKLLLPFPSKQTLKQGSTDKQATFEVSLDDAIMPGLYHLRLATENGVSLPVIVGIDSLSQKPLTATIDALPAAIHGTVTGSTVAETTFAGKANEKIAIEVEAQRLGSKLRPIIHLYGPKKLQLGWGWSTPHLSGDTRLVTTLSETGTYTITVHDAEYAGPSPGHFRLKIGSFGYVDHVFPPVAGKETKSFELIGSTASRVDLQNAKGDPILLPWPKSANGAREIWTGSRPWVPLSSRREFIETTIPGKPMELPIGPVAVSGKLATANEEDRYRVAVIPNTKIRFEVFAERIGSPVDAALVIRNDAGAVLAQVEDSPGSLDPILEYTVPDKVTAVTVGVIDSSGLGGPWGIYRLVIDPVKTEGQGDFHLTTSVQRLSLPSGGRAIVPVYVDRRGYVGKLALSADELPPGLKLEGTTITPDADGTLVVVSANEFSSAAITTWKARGDTGELRNVFQKGHPLERLQPWLATELSIAPITAKATDFTVDWRNLPADAGLSPGGKLTLLLTVKRLDPATPVRFALLTSQAPPLTNNQPDPNRAIRPEKPIELAAKVSDGEFPVLVPPELPADSYQIALQAELLSPDKQKVLATAVTPVRTMPVKLPVAVKLEAPTKIEAKLDAKTGATVEVKGTVDRLNGFTGEVVVSLTGLPPGVAVPPPLTVKAAETRFAFKLTIPPTTPPYEAKLKLSASVVPDPKQPNVRVKSRDVDFVLAIQAVAK
ncbi:MAG TPA: hypothetical protein VG097_21050 [Gemmata sp.]|nr:hypothetical protein [Gemmata sp.]